MVSRRKSNSQALRIFVVLLVGLVFLGVAGFGQETASIVGTVSDPTGAAVPNAKIVITNTDTGLARPLTSNSSGAYTAPQLAIGRYSVRVEAPGFKAFEQTGIVLNVAAVVRADATLTVGESKESVTVEANA